MPIFDVIIVGAGPAGCSAAIQCHRLGHKPYVIDQQGCAGGLAINAYSIENYLGIEVNISGLDFVKRIQSQLASFNIEIHAEKVKQITRIDSEFLVVTTKAEYCAHSVIIATGTEPKKLSLPIEKQVHKALVFYDVMSLLQTLSPSPRTIAICGGGEAACDYALTLAHRNIDVVLVNRHSFLRANVSLQQRVLHHSRIRIMPCIQLIGIHADPYGLRLQSQVSSNNMTEIISCNGLLVAIGRQANLPRIEIDGSVQSSFTNIVGLCVIGDAKHGHLGQISIAAGEGLQAAHQVNTWLTKAV